MDKVSKEVRSRNMAAIKGKDTKPEILVRKFLFNKGFRYKLYDRSLPGTPDLVFPKYRKVLFVHGCFWHGHEGCKYFVIPKTRTEWWIAKINRNKQLDNENMIKLRKLGWKVITTFECRLRPQYRSRTLNLLVARFTK
jgi:DNA mismatch endonuclease (patch repair protein)